MTRPWRLTRRQRVEMEASLAALRHSAAQRHQPHWLSCDRGAFLLGSADHDWIPATRVYRARVALALRAALRADEDARCEEVLARARAHYPDEYEYRHLRDGAEEHCDALREWSPVRAVPYEWPEGVEVPPSVLTITIPGVGRMVLASRVPLALWERRPSLWAQSPPTSGGPRRG